MTIRMNFLKTYWWQWAGTVQFEMLSGFWYQLRSRLNIVHRRLFCGFISNLAWLSFRVCQYPLILSELCKTLELVCKSMLKRPLWAVENPFVLFEIPCWSQWRALKDRLLTWKLGGLRNTVLSWSLFFNQTAIFEWCDEVWI